MAAPDGQLWDVLTFEAQPLAQDVAAHGEDRGPGPAPELRTILGSRGSRRLHPVSYRWRVVTTLMQDDSGLLPEDSVRLTGYQYVDWQFDGDDLIYVVRTASRGARNFHRLQSHPVRPRARLPIPALATVRQAQASRPNDGDVAGWEVIKQQVPTPFDSPA